MIKEKKIFPNNILDIKFSGNKAYILKEINISSSDIEEQLKVLCYTGEGRKKSKYTENKKFPPFAQAFFHLLFLYQKIPSEDEFIEFYVNNFFRRDEQGTFSCLYQDQNFRVDYESFKGRILRTYPSLIRDYHFYLKCTESKKFDKVYYSLKEDYFEGIDITVVYQGHSYHISLYTKTSRAKLYKRQKYKRHDYNNKNEIILEVNFKKESMKISDFYLYSDMLVGKTFKKIEEMEFVN